MPPQPTRILGDAIDLAPRVARSATVVASPADATETIIASVTINRDLDVGLGIMVKGFAAYTVGTAGVSGNLRIRRTNVAGTIVKATGALTVVATELHAPSILALDTGIATAGAVYVLTLTVASASAASTVSAVELIALVI